MGSVETLHRGETLYGKRSADGIRRLFARSRWAYGAIVVSYFAVRWWTSPHPIVVSRNVDLKSA